MGETVGVSVGLEQAAAAYKEGPTPELVRVLWEKFWGEAGVKLDRELWVEPFPGTSKGLVEHLRGRDMPIYVPPELAGQEDRHLLGQMWPEMRSHSVQPGNRVSNEEVRSGWRYIEASLIAPYLGTSESELERKLASQGRDGQNETEYIIGSQMSKKLTGHYFDEETWSRLLGSRGGSRVVFAFFDADGYLDVFPGWAPQEGRGGLGGRSSVGVV